MIEIRQFEQMRYMIRFPEIYEAGKKYPVIIFLHGAGTREIETEALKESGYLKFSGQYAQEPFIAVVPHCQGVDNTWFDMLETVKKFVRMLIEEEYTDKKRIYLTGNSMGGYGTWQLAMSMPEVFAAIVPVCGGGMYWNAGRLVNVPVWAFHGGKDPIVFPEESKKMVDGVNKAGGNAKLTIYPENFHDSWTDTYSNPKVYEWMFSHENMNHIEVTTEYNDSAIYG